MDMDVDLAVSTNWGSFKRGLGLLERNLQLKKASFELIPIRTTWLGFLEKWYRAPFKGIWNCFQASLELILIRTRYGCFCKLGVLCLGILVMREPHYLGSILGPHSS